MEIKPASAIAQRINDLSSRGIPFLFIFDFEGEYGSVIEFRDLIASGVYCSINGVEYGKAVGAAGNSSAIEAVAIPFKQYRESFDKVQNHINNGDTYLLNLTCATALRGDIDMAAIYRDANARYKFMDEGHFVFYSPEPFVRIENNYIYSFPMKGTISMNEPNAKEHLLGDKKELYEHYTIVDLIRNDLSMVSNEVEVVAFRYVEAINKLGGGLLQTSSTIRGRLDNDWTSRLGDILLTLLPAGSVSGAPKQKTVEIIHDAELCPRGFYTGIMGICADGKVDSCVNIRYIERSGDGNYYYRSGGGITSRSDAEEEYKELLDKIYVPTN